MTIVTKEKPNAKGINWYPLIIVSLRFVWCPHTVISFEDLTFEVSRRRREKTAHPLVTLQFIPLFVHGYTCGEMNKSIIISSIKSFVPSA